MPAEPLSPELVLVDPDLGARARAALPVHAPAPRRPSEPAVAPAPSPAEHARETVRPYPVWARLTAALWVLVVGILIGGAAIPHAQDQPRVVPPAEDATVCEPAPAPPRPARPGGPNSPLRP